MLFHHCLLNIKYMRQTLICSSFKCASKFACLLQSDRREWHDSHTHLDKVIWNLCIYVQMTSTFSNWRRFSFAIVIGHCSMMHIAIMMYCHCLRLTLIFFFVRFLPTSDWISTRESFVLHDVNLTYSIRSNLMFLTIKPWILLSLLCCFNIFLRHSKHRKVAKFFTSIMMPT